MKKEENTDEVLEFEETTEAGDEKTLQEKVKDLRMQLKEKAEESKINLDGWQRARAELVNKDKQMQVEKLEIYRGAAANLLEDLIPVLDSYGMARKNVTTWEKVEANWRMGVEYIFQQLTTTCENAGLKKIEPKVGDKFDVNTMHAVEEVQADDETKDHTVSEIIQSGYDLNGKQLREAKVKIYIFK